MSAGAARIIHTYLIDTLFITSANLNTLILGLYWFTHDQFADFLGVIVRVTAYTRA